MKMERGAGGSSVSKSESTRSNPTKLNKKTIPTIPGEWRTIRLNSVGMRFINGVSNSYDSIFPTELEGIMSIEDFQYAVTRINNTLIAYWPCATCFIGGYACSICTLGLSFLLPSMCIQDSERYLKRLLREYNCSRRFADRNVTWTLQKRCLNSWIEIKYFYKPQYSYLAINNETSDITFSEVNDTGKEEVKEEDKQHTSYDGSNMISESLSNEGIENLIMDRTTNQQSITTESTVNEKSNDSNNSLILRSAAEGSSYDQRKKNTLVETATL